MAESWWYDVTQYSSVQEAISTALSNGGGQVYFPAGNYTIDATVVNNDLSGDPNFSPIMLLGQGDASVITIETDTTLLAFTKTVGLTISDLAFQCAAETATESVGINLSGVHNYRLSRLTIGAVGGANAPAYGIQTAECAYATEISECTVYGRQAAIQIEDGADISNCQQIQGGIYGIILRGAPGTTHIVSCALYAPLALTTISGGAEQTYNALWAYDLEANYVNTDPPENPPEGAGSLYLAHVTAEIHLSDCFLQNGVLIGSYLSESDQEAPGPVFIEGCELSNVPEVTPYTGTESITTACLEIANGSHVIIRGNSVDGALYDSNPVGNGIQIDSGSPNLSKVLISDNCIYGSTLACISLGINDYFDVHDNSCEGASDAAAAITFAPPIGQHGRISDNAGFNPAGAYEAVSTPASGTPISNNFGLDGTFYISNPPSSNVVVTSVAIQKDPLGSGTFQDVLSGSSLAPLTIWVPAGGAFKITYSGSGSARPAIQFIGN